MAWEGHTAPYPKPQEGKVTCCYSSVDTVPRIRRCRRNGYQNPRVMNTSAGRWNPPPLWRWGELHRIQAESARLPQNVSHALCSARESIRPFIILGGDALHRGENPETIDLVKAKLD